MCKQGQDNKLQQQGNVSTQGVEGMTDAAKFWQDVDAQRAAEARAHKALAEQAATNQDGGNIYGQQLFLSGWKPPSAAPREKDLLGQAVRLAEFLKPMDPQTRHAVWDLAQSALNAVSRTEERERRARAQKDTEEREQLKRNTRGNRAMRNGEDTDLDEDEDEDD